MSIDLKQYGISPELSAETFGKCVDLINAYNAASEKADNGNGQKVSEVRKSMAEEQWNTASDFLKSADEKIRRFVFDQEDGNLSAAMVDLLTDILSDVREEANYQAEKVVRATRPEKVTDSNLATMKEVAEAASSFARKIYEMLPLIGNDEELAKIPTKNGKNGVLPDVPRIKSGARDSDGISPRVKRMRLVCNGETLPVGTLMSEVAHEMISDDTYRVSANEIRELVESQNGKPWHDSGWTATNHWLVIFPNDKELEGWNESE